MSRHTSGVWAIAAALLLAGHAGAQVRNHSLESSEGLILHNVVADPVTLDGKRGVRLALSPEARREFDRMTPAQRGQRPLQQFASIRDLMFGDGVIEVELAGAPAKDASAGARGFVGVAFRLQPDNVTYDAFYLRPTNGRADDQERRNRSVQYISHPEWPWYRLRKETPAKYEVYVDLVPGAWTKVKIEVRGSQGRLFVHGHEQPTLIVNDLKTGPAAKGAVALWLDTGTVAHFRNLTVEALPNP